MKIDVPGKTLKQITKLDLSNMSLTKIPNDVFECTNLTKLVLRNNFIREIPKEITILRKLKTLDISFNNINHIYANVFKLPKLLILDLSHNKLKNLPTQLENSQLKVLLVQYNAISSINESLIKNLEKLNISHNNINILNISSRIVLLKSLWISSNPIKEFLIKSDKVPFLKNLYAFTENIQEVSHTYRILTLIKGNCFSYLPQNQTKPNTDLSVAKPKIDVDNMRNEKLNIFISYSHDDDKKWIDLLRKHLKVLNRLNDKIDYWDDTRIHTGDKWKEEIENSLNKSAVAILLVSTSFLASDFIQNKELPILLKKAETEGTKIFPVILEPCLFDAYSDINQFQAVNNPNKPLCDNTFGDQNRLMVDLMKDILRMFNF